MRTYSQVIGIRPRNVDEPRRSLSAVLTQSVHGHRFAAFSPFETIREAFDMTEILNSAQVAELLGCSVRTVEDHARAGTLKGTKFGDGWIFLSDMLVDAVRAKCDTESSARQKKNRKTSQIQMSPQAKPAFKRPPGMGHLSEEAISKILRPQ